MSFLLLLGWDADFATKAYRQQVEALTQIQVLKSTLIFYKASPVFPSTREVEGMNIALNLSPILRFSTLNAFVL